MGLERVYGVLQQLVEKESECICFVVFVLRTGTYTVVIMRSRLRPKESRRRFYSCPVETSYQKWNI